MNDSSITGLLRVSLDSFLIIAEPKDNFGNRNSRGDDNWKVRDTTLRSAKQ